MANSLMQLSKNKKIKYQEGSSKLISLAISLSVIGLCVIVALNKQNIRDWWVLRSYQPPATVSSLADQIDLTPESRKFFYVNKPEIINDSRFIQACPSGSREKTIVLGCYHGNQFGIFILDVKDSRLAGVEQVTAGHEMLHAAYDRLSSSDKERVDKMLTDYYKTITDDRIKDTIEAYKVSEPNDIPNEMHSIFGTEIPNLPPNLENYYSKYFKNRATVVGYSQRYQSEFTTRKNKIADADAQLTVYKTKIDNLETQLKQEVAVIDSRDEQMSSLKDSGNYEAYNAMVGPYNKLVYAYNAQINNLQSLIDKHNALVAQRNAIVLEQSQLMDSLQPNVKKINN